jgi:hypothetical protein
VVSGFDDSVCSYNVLVFFNRCDRINGTGIYRTWTNGTNGCAWTGGNFVKYGCDRRDRRNRTDRESWTNRSAK